MDLLSIETPQITIKHRGFRSLKMVNVDMDEPLGETLFGADYNRLKNGLTYYVCIPSLK